MSFIKSSIVSIAGIPGRGNEKFQGEERSFSALCCPIGLGNFLRIYEGRWVGGLPIFLSFCFSFLIRSAGRVSKISKRQTTFCTAYIQPSIIEFTAHTLYFIRHTFFCYPFLSPLDLPPASIRFIWRGHSPMWYNWAFEQEFLDLHEMSKALQKIFLYSYHCFILLSHFYFYFLLPSLNLR